MKRVLMYAGIPVLLAAIVILTVVPVADSAMYSTTYYNIYYSNLTQYRWARSLAPFLGRAFWAARTTIAWDARLGKMKIHFSYQRYGLGWMVGGRQDIYLSVPYFRSFNKWGSVVAEQSAKVLFYNFTRAHLWNRYLTYYKIFLTDSLALYAGNYVYYYFQYNPSTAFNEIRSRLRYYASRTGSTMSWYDSGYIYKNGSGNYVNQATWQLKAIGWFLTGGRLTSSSPQVRMLLLTMRALGTMNGRYLRSSNFDTARHYFEYSFKAAYGKYANSGWDYTGAGGYKDTRYLYGIFWVRFYK